MSRFTYKQYIEEMDNSVSNKIKSEAIELYSHTNNYEIERQLYFNTIEEALNEAKKLYDRIYYMLNHSRNKYRYEKVSCIIGVSNKDGKSAKKIKEKTKGRPKHIIIGRDKEPHIHIIVLGENSSRFCEDLIKKLNYHNNPEIFKELKKRFKYELNTEKKKLLLYKKSKLREDNNNGLYYLSYIYNQSLKTYNIGYVKNNYKSFF